jgi:integrating conjugative element protein (TIGR03756 family)
MKIVGCIGLGLCWLVSTAQGAVPLGETTNVAQILTQSANFLCLQYRPVGACLWMTCTPFGCDFEWSVKVRHNIPDAVVTSYHVTGSSPWLETRGYASPNALAQDGGTNAEGSTVVNETALRFKNVDVIGSPGTAWIEALQNSGYFCDPTTTPYRPYFLSTLDPNWRSPAIETPWTLRHILRYVRSGLVGGSTWGPVYPRTGFVHNGHDYKVGAVTAQRAADIVTRRYQPHVYWPMLDEGAAGQWPPGEVLEGDEETHLWQQLIPASESTDCRVFADQGDQASGPSDPFSERLSQNTGYAFNLWRPYRCCEREGAVLIYHFGE